MSAMPNLLVAPRIAKPFLLAVAGLAVVLPVIPMSQSARTVSAISLVSLLTGALSHDQLAKRLSR